MQARLRRLSADYQQVQNLVAAQPRILLVRTEGTPPERYTFAVNVAGLVPVGDDNFVPGNVHQEN